MIGPWGSRFGICRQMRGLERVLRDLGENPELVDAILARIKSIQTAMMGRLFARARQWLDLVCISDEIARQESQPLPPAMWEPRLQPRPRLHLLFLPPTRAPAARATPERPR